MESDSTPPSVPPADSETESVEYRGQELAIRYDDTTEGIEYKDIKDALASAFTEAYATPLTAVKWLATHEVSEEGKPHWHIYCQLDGPILVKQETFNKNLNKKMKKLLPAIPKDSSYKCHQFVRDFDGYIKYILKHARAKQNIVDQENMSDDEVELFIQKTEEINADKKKTLNEKVCDFIADKPVDRPIAFIRYCIEYYKSIKKPPPRRHVVHQHFAYYLVKHENYDALEQLYGLSNIII